MSSSLDPITEDALTPIQSRKPRTWIEVFNTLVNFSLHSNQNRSRHVLKDCTRLCEAKAPLSVDPFRRIILPVLPEVNDSNEFYSLHANIFDDQLSEEERALRRNYLHCGHDIETSPDVADEMSHTLRRLLNMCSRKWNVNQNVLIVNFKRLLILLSQLTLSDYIAKQESKLVNLSIEEWFIVLEFYLQMDVQCFFMKTCSFRLATVRCTEEGLFCLTQPDAHYGMKPCRDSSCRFCYERLDLTHRFEQAMSFSSRQIHYFVNHYQVYLNCDVTCTSANVLYALTCPCHQYDYVGRCQGSIRDRMWQHRMNGCRIMSNFFLGPAVADRLQDEREANPQISASHIKLYRHSTECPVAMQIFLECHPRYWCFVPMSSEQAMLDDRSITLEDERQFSEQTREEAGHHRRETVLSDWCVDHLPCPPSNYQFSRQQRMEQWDFLRHRLDLYPSRFLDLYNAAIVVALPENTSDEVRHLLQALLVAHAEPKLNCTVFDQATDCTLSSAHGDHPWYQQLVHPRFRS